MRFIIKDKPEPKPDTVRYITKFAWLPVRTSDETYSWVWLERYTVEQVWQVRDTYFLGLYIGLKRRWYTVDKRFRYSQFNIKP